MWRLFFMQHSRDIKHHVILEEQFWFIGANGLIIDEILHKRVVQWPAPNTDVTLLYEQGQQATKKDKLNYSQFNSLQKPFQHKLHIITTETKFPRTECTNPVPTNSNSQAKVE